jgi:hypothetical protein
MVSKKWKVCAVRRNDFKMDDVVWWYYMNSNGGADLEASFERRSKMIQKIKILNK